MVAIAVPRPLAGDLLELTKPRIVVLVMVTVGAGFWLAQPSAAHAFALFHLFLGTALVAAGTNALNQVWERDVDARMARTRGRPLPAGRLTPAQANAFAWSAGLGGIAYLWLTVNGWTAGLAAVTLASYVFLYTPLKRRTTLATLVGAVPGALPIVGGWTAAQGAPDARAWVLFWIVFLWQLPHFLALAWLFREDYARAGLRMLSVDDPSGRMTFRYAALYAAALVPASLAPSAFGIAGSLYFACALACSALFLAAAVYAAVRVSSTNARLLFRASLVYLPAILVLMSANRAL